MNAASLLRLAGRVRSLRRHDRWSRRELEAHQAREVERAGIHAYAHSRFFRRFHQGATDAPLQELPPLTRPLLMHKYDEVSTDPAPQLLNWLGERYWKSI